MWTSLTRLLLSSTSAPGDDGRSLRSGVPSVPGRGVTCDIPSSVWTPSDSCVYGVPEGTTIFFLSRTLSPSVGPPRTRARQEGERPDGP